VPAVNAVNLFLSTVSAEFRSYRDTLRHDLDRPKVAVKVQEDFIATGSATLDKLDTYLAGCDAVVHLVGDMTGALAQAPSLALIRQRYPDLASRLPPLAPSLEPGAPALSYTHWEAWLALYHRKTLLIAVPEDGASRDAGYRFEEAQRVGDYRALAIDEASFGDAHPRVAIRLNNLAQLLRAMIQSDEEISRRLASVLSLRDGVLSG